MRDDERRELERRMEAERENQPPLLFAETFTRHGTTKLRTVGEVAEFLCVL